MRRISGVRPFVAAVAAISIAALACGGGGGSGAGGTTSTGGSGDAGACPVGAIDKAGKPVDITLWHSMTRANEDALIALTDEFNGAQTDVHVTLVNQTSYTDTFTKFKAGLASGELPDLVQIEDTGLQLMIDSQAVLPAQDCVDAVDYDTSDYLDRVLAYYTVDGTLWPVPFNVSNPILYYDRAAFERAGLDPDDPPTTFDDVETAARAIVGSNAAGAGIAIKLDPWLLEQWSALAGATYVDHGNGREERARAVAFDGEAGLEIFEWLNRMADEGLATITGPGGFDNLLAIGSHGAAMTVDTSAALGTIAQVLSGGDYADVSLGVGPMPGGSGEGGILVGGAALYILNTSSPAEQEAAWRYATFLNEPQSQSTWAAATGYLPIRPSATELAPLRDRWAAQPEFRVAYDQLLAGPVNSATAGPVIGDYAGVRAAVLAGLQAMLTEGRSPADALASARDAANAAITEYNKRIGA